MKYDLITPCASCPFRSDIRPFINGDRAQEILESQGTFPCHKTVDYSGDDSDGRETETSQHCAGFLILMEREDTPNQMMRIAERLGLYDRRKLRMDAPVYESVGACLKAHYKANA